MGDTDLTKRQGAQGESANEAPTGPSHAAAPSIARNAVFALLTQITTGVFTTAVTLYLLRVLGPDGYGVFALALGIAAVAGIVADFGIPYSVSRFLAESRDDKAAVAAVLSDALRLKLASAALVTGALFAAAGPLAAAYDEPALVWPLRALALSLFAESVLGLYVSSFIGLARVAVNLRLIFLESMVETAASIALVALGAGAAGAAFGRAIGYLVGAIVAIAIVVRLYGRSAVRPLGRGSGRTRDIARYAAPLFVTNSAYTLYAQIDILIIGALLGTTAVGLFSAPLRLSMPLAYLGQALANSVAPRQAGKGRETGSVEAFQMSLRWLILFQAVLLAPLIVWAEPIVQLVFGPSFSGSVDVLRVLSLYIFVDGPSRLISTSVNYLGYAARRIPIVILALAVNAAIDVALLPWIGVVGAAIGTGVALSFVYLPAHLRICVQELALDLRPLAATLVRALAAAGVMAGILFAVGTESLSAGEWLLGGTGGLLAFLVVLVLTREITATEVRHLWRAAAGNLSRAAPFRLR
jgi:O-antigen/teichoic acid export membrane protein